MTELYYYKPGESADWARYAPLLPFLSSERQERIQRMPSVQNKILSLCAELILRQIACKRLSVANSALRLAAAEHGKPFFADYEHFFFNWSHAKDALALAIADQPVGIDIEAVPPRGDVRKLAARFFTKKEASYVSKETSGCDVRFCEIWTRKEAYVKYTGSGLTVAPDSFDVTEDPKIVPLLSTFRHGAYILSLCCAAGDHELIELTEKDVLLPP